MLIFDRLIEILGTLSGIVVGSKEFLKLKLAISFFAIFFVIALLLYYIYLERKYKIGTEIILTTIKNFLEAFVLKKEVLSKEWLDIKKVFLLDKKAALIKVYYYLNRIIDFYGYSGNTLEEKFKNFPDSVFENKNDFLKSVKILEILKNKIDKKEEIKLNEEEILFIIKVIEKGLVNLLIIDPENQWANFLI
jgi:hypothetical protein